MVKMTFILGIERFTAHVWSQVEHDLQAAGVAVRIQRFHDGHVEAQDPALAAAIADADVLFITLINMRESALWLAEQIAHSRAGTVFAFESMPEVMALNRVGEYRVSGAKGSMPKPMQAILRLITRGREEDTLYAYTRLTRLTAKLLPLMPPRLKDFRTWLSVNLYWNQPDIYNITQMVRLILRDCLAQPLEVGPLRPIPSMGCWHPAADQFFADPPAFLRWYAGRTVGPQGGGTADHQHGKTAGRGDGVRNGAAAVLRSFRLSAPSSSRPLVALIAFRKHVVQKQRYLNDLIDAFEAQGLGVLPIFVSGIELHVAVREWLLHQPVDMLVNAMGFPLVGGPAGSTKPGHYREQAATLLAGLDVPYMVAQPLQMQDEADWHARGVAPMQAVIMYDLPEMDGSIAPVTIGAIRGQELTATPDRLARAAHQVAAWVKLRRTPPAQRRVAFVVYNFPPGLGRIGTAALLDVPASLHAILTRLRAEGYTLPGLPESPAALAERIAALDDAQSHDLTLPVDTYRRLVPEPHAARIDAYWGSPPGEIAPRGAGAIRLDGFELGNVFVGVQPPMGVPGDPMRLLFDTSFTPHHQYVAFYRWLTDVWRADAIVHVGMHGTAEWMPGLQLGLTNDCWPDLLLGDVPQLYLYPLNNPAEATIARRRGLAAIVSHLVPPYARAGLYKQLAQARALLAPGQASVDLAALAALLPELACAPGEPDQAFLARACAYLDELEQRLILDGLHVVGQVPSAERATALIEAALEVSRDGQPGLSAQLEALGVPPDRRLAARTAFVTDLVITAHPPAIEHWLQHWGAPTQHDQAGALAGLPALQAHGRAILAGLRESQAELDVLVHALAGGYVRPAPGADPVRAGAAALPSGRNIHGIDPWRLPSAAAVERGWRMAAALLQRHCAAQGSYPRTVALTLWALDTIKSEGESLGAALALVGARPAYDGQGKIWCYELIPLAELGRPRIDLLLDISPIFRDTFQMSLNLLDDLFRRVAAADEPLDQNFVRANALDLQAQGMHWDQATARIFTQAPGKYGTGVDELIDESAWNAREDLAETYVRRNAFAYGKDRGGAPATATLRGLLGTVDHVFQAIDSVEYGLTDMQHYYGHTGAIQLAAGQARGDEVPLTYAESYTGTVRLNSARELLNVEARSKLLNPRWFEGMLAHGFAGAAEIGNRFTYLVGWSAVSNVVEPWVFEGAATTFVLDDAMRQRLEAANPRAARNAVARLLESNDRGLWHADEATLARLQEIYADLEDRLEGVSA